MSLVHVFEPCTGAGVPPIQRLLHGTGGDEHDLRQILVFLDAAVINKPELMVSQVMTKVDAATRQLTEPGTRGFISKQLEALATRTRCAG